MTKKYDLIVKGGNLFFSSLKRFVKADLGIHNGKIVSHGDFSIKDAEKIVDAKGAIVAPGLIDMHTHVYWGGTPLGINPDKIASMSGVTTWVDMGSAGAGNFEGLYHHVIKRSKLRIFTFLNLSCIGLVSVGNTTLRFGELFDERLADVNTLIQTIQQYHENIKGLKLRVGMESSLNHGKAMIDIALEIGDRLDLPIAIHATSPPPRIRDILPLLRKGDMFTHCYCGSNSTSILDRAGNILPEAKEARERGVFFDLGHGAKSFSFLTAEKAIEQGFFPDFISSDLHAYSLGVPVEDLPSVIAKLVNIGMPFEEALHKVTFTPAKYLGIDREAGDIDIGFPADFTILRWSDEEISFSDGEGTTRKGKTLKAISTYIRGELLTHPPEDGRTEEKWKPGLVKNKPT